MKDEEEIQIPESGDAEFSRLAWELARRASFRLAAETNPGTSRRIAATIETHAGPVIGFGSTHTEAMRHLAEGLDLWAAEFEGQPIPTTESVVTNPIIIVSESSHETGCP